MTPHCGPGCPFRGCPSCEYRGGQNPAETSEYAGQAARMGALAHTRETPAKAATSRGRGPTVEESNVNDATPETSPVAGA